MYVHFLYKFLAMCLAKESESIHSVALESVSGRAACNLKELINRHSKFQSRFGNHLGM